MSEINQDNYVGKINFRYFEKYSKMAREAGHKYFIGDIPVTKPLLTFFKAIKAKRYNIVACVDGKSIFARNENTNMEYYQWEKIGITYPDTKEWRIGEISVDSNDKSEEVYLVHSMKIENEKFSPNNDGYHIRKSTDIANSVKLALTYFKPMSLEDLQQQSSGGLHSALVSVRAPAQEKFMNTFTVERNEILKEVTHMIASGYAPLTQEFTNAVELLKSEGDELKRLQNYKPRVCFVWIKPDSMLYKYSDDDRVTEITNPNDIPEELRNKIAVLQIANTNSSLVDVGVRLSNSTYWVFV
jgi:hypothetical protein